MERAVSTSAPGWERAVTPEGSVTNELDDMLIQWTPAEVRTHPHEAAVRLDALETAARQLVARLDLFLQSPDAAEVRKDALAALGDLRKLLDA